jgi:uncharacterized Zn-finger protein
MKKPPAMQWNTQQERPMTKDKKAHTPDPEVIYVDTLRVSCNGGDGTLGHPIVWYSLEDGEAECGYCDVKFIYRAADAEQA